MAKNCHILDKGYLARSCSYLKIKASAIQKFKARDIVMNLLGPNVVIGLKAASVVYLRLSLPVLMRSSSLPGVATTMSTPTQFNL